LNAKQIRWLEFLCECDFDIKHIKGKESKLVDALNRRVHEMHATAITIYSSNLNNIILGDANLDKHYLQPKESIHQGHLYPKYKDYGVGDDGILLHKNRVCVPNLNQLRNLILKETRNVVYVGNQGYQKTIASIKKQYFW